MAERSVIDGLAAELTETAPQPTQGAGAAEVDRASAVDPRWKDLRDRYGNGWDPRIHLANPDGSPKVHPRTGRLQGKPGRPLPRPPKSAAGLPPPERSRVAHEEPSEPRRSQSAPDPAATELARSLVRVGVSLSVAVFGDAWKPKSEGAGKAKVDEEAELTAAVAGYFEARGMPRPAPSVALLVAIGSYAAPRLLQDETQERIAKGIDRLVGWAKRGFKRASSTGARDDTHGQDDTREEARYRDAVAGMGRARARSDSRS